jgi:hypothetical protein
MTFIDRKKQTSFFLIILLVSQLCFEKTPAESSQEINKTSFRSAKIVAAEIAMKPTVSSPDTLIRYQHQLMFSDISSVAAFKNTTLKIKQYLFISAHVHNSNNFLFNRVLRI